MVALGWFLFLSVAGLYADMEQMVLINAIMAGVMAVGALRYAAIPGASLSFLGSGIVVSALYAFQSSVPGSVFAFLAVYAVLLGRSVMGHAHLFSAQFDAGLALASAAAERGRKGGKPRAANMTPERRAERARKAAERRWRNREE